MSERCKDTEIEPKLTLLSGEELQGRTSNKSKEAQVDIRTWCFWEQGQQTFFDLGIFDPCFKSLQQCHVMNEQEKKQAYNERILQIDHGIFASLVFSINGGMGREPQKTYSHLAQMISEKRPSAVDFMLLDSNKSLLWVAKIKSPLFNGVENREFDS